MTEAEAGLEVDLEEASDGRLLSKGREEEAKAKEWHTASPQAGPSNRILL